MDYNVEYQVTDINIVAGDTIDLTYAVTLNAVAYDMTGMQLDMIIRDRTGTATKTLSSAGTSPAITISTTSWNVTTTAITVEGLYTYDVQLTNGSTVSTIMAGKIMVTRQVT